MSDIKITDEWLLCDLSALEKTLLEKAAVHQEGPGSFRGQAPSSAVLSDGCQQLITESLPRNCLHLGGAPLLR